MPRNRILLEYAGIPAFLQQMAIHGGHPERIPAPKAASEQRRKPRNNPCSLYVGKPVYPTSSGVCCGPSGRLAGPATGGRLGACPRVARALRACSPEPATHRPAAGRAVPAQRGIKALDAHHGWPYVDGPMAPTHGWPRVHGWPRPSNQVDHHAWASTRPTMPRLVILQAHHLVAATTHGDGHGGGHEGGDDHDVDGQHLHPARTRDDGEGGGRRPTDDAQHDTSGTTP